MSNGVVELECPGCAAALSFDTKTCPKCFRPIVISSLSMVHGFSPIDLKKQLASYNKVMISHPDDENLNLSQAFCYMQLKLYDKAIPCFEKALETNFDNADAFFYAAIALLQGKKAFLAKRDTINKIVEYINAANMIEPKGIYHYYLAYIKYDYFARKSLNNAPDYQECLASAMSCGLTDADIGTLYELLGVERPSVL